MSKPAPPQSPAPVDPRTQGPQPEYPQKPIEVPGSIDEMTPRADHGEESYRGLGRLEGRVALITGGDSGIGRAVAIAYAREGADLLLSYLPEEEGDGADTCGWVEQAGRRAVGVPGDIRDEQHCQALVDRVVRRVRAPRHPRQQRRVPDDARPHRGVLDRGVRPHVQDQRLRDVLAVPCRAAADGGGRRHHQHRLDSGLRPSPNLLAYAPTKAAIVNFTKALSQMAMEKGVRVNAVAPGPVWTPLIPSTMPEERVKKFGEDTVFERAAQPVEIAPVFVFLASNESRFVSGEVYGVTGGKTPY
jgi:NAD(P)-dependent dehydrogenase (short-subunit alcohol dehydrogenase family)